MKTTFTLFLLLVCTTAFGQRNFVPGYYLNHNGEKFSVYINDQNWEHNPRSIQVRKDLESGPVQTFHVTDIKGFGLSTGDAFESYIGDVEKGPTELKEVMLFDAKPVIVQDTVFLRTLVKGNINLYHLQYRKGDQHYFIQKGEEKPVELIYRTTRQVNVDRAGFTRLPIYKGMLRVKLTDCPDVAKKIDGVSFKKSALTGIVENYNECVTGTKGEYTAEVEKAKLRMGLVGGGSYTLLTMRDEADKRIDDAGFRGSGPTFGSTFQVTLPRNFGRYSLMAELMYKPLRATGTLKQVNPSSDEVFVVMASDYKMDYLGLNLMGRYTLNHLHFKPFFNAGLGNNLLLRNRSHQQRTVSTYGSETHYNDFMHEIRPFEEALLIGVGGEWSNWQAEVRFDRGSGFYPYTGVKARHTNYSFRLSYLLYSQK